MLLKLFPAGTKINFIKYRKIYFAISLFMLALAIFSYATQGLNFGIDFKGGILIEVRKVDSAGRPESVDLAAMRQKLEALKLGDTSLQLFGAESDVLIRVQTQKGGDQAQAKAIQSIRTALGDGYNYRRQDYVGPAVGEELIQAGIMATLFAILAILAYVWFRFEWQFGVAAIIALTHDVLLTLGLFAEIDLEFNLATVAAVLTIAGYSINDTVVVFDRVRENMRRYKKMPMPELMNVSLNETLTRTLMTSVTTLLALGALYAFGGEVIRGFSLALIWGVLVGTYSSICLAVPFLLMLGVKRGTREPVREAVAEKSVKAADKVQTVIN